jgi:hypothetical protein
MAGPGVPRHAVGMSRAADNDLYNLGSDLVEAATGIARNAADPEAAAAIPALLGCIEAALDELRGAAGALREAGGGNDPRHERLARGYANLGIALADAATAAAAARSLAARVNESPRGERARIRRGAAS